MEETRVLLGIFMFPFLAAIASSSAIPADFDDDIKKVGSSGKLKKILSELTQWDKTLLRPKVHRFQENFPIQKSSDESIAREQDIIKQEESLLENLANDVTVTKSKLSLLRKMKNAIKRDDIFTSRRNAMPRPPCRCRAVHTLCLWSWCKGQLSDPSEVKAKEDKQSYKRSKLELLLDKLTKLQ